MEIKDICSIVVLAVVVIAYGINLLITIKSKKSSGATKNEIDNFIQEEISKLPQYILSAEELYTSISKDGVKTGALKLSNVLDNIKEDCESGGVTYDKSYWNELINGIVSVMNGGETKSFQTSEIASNGDTVANVIIKGE